jgi:hypothetical protein
MTIATTGAINGFQPARQFSSDRVMTFPVTNSGATLAIGDAVAVVNGLATKLALTDSPSSVAWGVVVGLKNADGRPLTFNQPDVGNYLADGESGFAEVLVDPLMTYTVRYTGTTSVGLVGDNVRANDAGVTVKTGVSGMSVRALASSDATTTPFKIVGLSDTVIAGGVGTDVYVEVALNNCWFKAGTLAQ